MSSLPSGTVTFLFTDIEGSTKLAQQYPEAMPALLARHNKILNRAIETHNGFVFQVVGDSYAASFHNANDALNAALQAQRGLHNENWNPAPIKVRMGIHTGAAQLQIDSKENKYLGYATIALTQRIMSAGHGGQILLSQTTHDLTRDRLSENAQLLDMGERRLKDILRAEHIYQMSVPDLPSEFAPLKTLDFFSHNLPVQLTSFIGRGKEVGQIKKRLEKNRLVTLTGSGGIGKTRLSIQVASELLGEYPNGVWLVELAPLTDPTLVIQTVCTALDVTPQDNTPALNVLTDYLYSKKLLLVVDNCEHLIDACAQLCDSLLHACPDLRIIASSREALGIDGENAYRVPSLSLPDSRSGLHAIEESEAVKLFMERATALLPEFEITESNATSVAQICQRLDGIALAIELAASRVKMLKVEQIASRLDNAFRLLTGGSRTALPRQQTLRALIDWSYNLLSDEERIVLRRLSVFVGGWPLEAAESVCDNPNMLDLLTHLVDKSLVAVDLEHGDEPRYYLLETIRQYAREKLAESGESEAIREQHTCWYVELAERAEPKIHGHGQLEWLDRMEQEHDNVRAALEWSLHNNIELGLQIANALNHFWILRGHYVEGFQQMEKLLAVEPLDSSPLHARALVYASWLAVFTDHEERAATLVATGATMSREQGYQEGLAFSLLVSATLPYLHGDHERALPLAEESLALFKEADIKWGIRQALGPVGYIMQAKGNYERARAAYQESLALSREIGDIEGVGWSLYLLGDLAFEQTSYEQALAFYEESLTVERELKVKPVTAWIIRQIGEVSILQGHYSQAKALFEESIVMNREMGDHRRVATALNRLGRVARLQGEYEQAGKHYAEGLRLARKNDGHQTMAWSLSSLAELAALCNQSKKAVRLWGAAEAIPELYIDLWPNERLELEQIAGTIRAQLDEAIFKAEYEAGKQMSLDKAVAYALKELQ